MALLGDSSPLAEPVTAPSPDIRTPPLSTLFSAACFLQLACRPKHMLSRPCQAPSREARTDGQSDGGRQSGEPGSRCCLFSSWGRASCGSINDFFVWFVAECPLLQPPGNSLRPAALVSPRSSSSEQLFFRCPSSFRV